MIEPASPEELAASLAEAASARRTIRLGGNFTKDRLCGPFENADVTISTRRMSVILSYEAADLTVSVEAGITYAELSKVLAGHRQMIPLDPPWGASATIGGILAANTSGPRARLYGTARDMVIGMTFATLEGKLVQTGGMVVKNVAGLDMSKLMIGSFGTLAGIAIANFRVHPMPAGTRTFEWAFDNITDAISTRDRVMKSQLQPAAVDVVKGDGAYRVVVQAGGSAAVLDRYKRELTGARILEGEEEAECWRKIQEFTPEFLKTHDNGYVEQIPCKLTEVASILEKSPGAAIARGTVVYVAVSLPVSEPVSLAVAQASGLRPTPTDQKIKSMMDPHGLLNRSR